MESIKSKVIAVVNNNIIYCNFRNQSLKNDSSITNDTKQHHISTWVGKNKKKYISIKFSAILNSEDKDKKILGKELCKNNLPFF